MSSESMAMTQEIRAMQELAQTDIVTLVCRGIGVIGFLLYLIAFASLQLRWLCGHSRAHTLLSMMAAACVLVGLSVDFNLASALIQFSWIALGSIGLIINQSSKRGQEADDHNHSPKLGGAPISLE